MRAHRVRNSEQAAILPPERTICRTKTGRAIPYVQHLGPSTVHFDNLEVIALKERVNLLKADVEAAEVKPRKFARDRVDPAFEVRGQQMRCVFVDSSEACASRHGQRAYFALGRNIVLHAGIAFTIDLRVFLLELVCLDELGGAAPPVANHMGRQYKGKRDDPPVFIARPAKLEDARLVSRGNDFLQ